MSGQMAPVVGLESSSDPGASLTHALLFIAIAVGMLSFVCAFLFSAHKLGSFCAKAFRGTRQPPHSAPERATSTTEDVKLVPTIPSPTLSWATLVDETIGAHPNAIPLDQRVYPPGYLSYIHLPVAFPSLPSTTRVGLVITQYHGKP